MLTQTIQNMQIDNPNSNHKRLFGKFVDKLKRTASKFKITPSHQYNPRPKSMSRRDRIRAGLQKRNQRNDNAIKNL